MPGNGTILALDLAGKCGYAYATYDGRIYSGMWRNSKRGVHPGEKFCALRDELRYFLHIHHSGTFPLRIAYEEPAYLKSRAANAALYGYLAVLQMVAADGGGSVSIDLRGWNITAVKKRATGHGNAKKPAMIAAAEREFPDQKITCSDQADALWVLKLELEQLARDGCLAA